MKLTPELLAQTVSSLNPVKERQLDLRGAYKASSHFHDIDPRLGYKIPTIENLGVTKARICSSWNKEPYQLTQGHRISTMR